MACNLHIFHHILHVFHHECEKVNTGKVFTEMKHLNSKFFAIDVQNVFVEESKSISPWE